MFAGLTASTTLRISRLPGVCNSIAFVLRVVVSICGTSAVQCVWSSASWSKMGLVVDLPTFGMAYMTGRKTQSREFNMAGQPVDSGVDAVGGTLTH